MQKNKKIKKLRIAIFTDTFLPQINGVVTATVNLAKGLADNGHEVHIFAPKYKIEKEFEYKNVKVKRYFGVPALFYEDFKIVLPNPFITNYLKKHKVDLIHFQTPISLGWQAISCARRLKLPLTGTFHTFFGDPEYLKHIKMNNKFGESVAWKISNLFYNKCDVVTSPSQKTKEELIKHGVTKKVMVISNGIDLASFDNSDSEKIKKKYKLKGKTLLFVGRIAYEKSIDIALDAFKIVQKKHPDAKYIIVGGGPQFEEIKKKVKQLKLEESVIMTGPIQRADLVKSGIFGACDIFLTASKTENQPVTVLEAIANGLPSVGVKAKGMVNVIDDDKTGFIVEPDNTKQIASAVLKLIEDKKLYTTMKKNCLESIEKEDVRYIIKIWEKLCIDLIKKNKEKHRKK